MAIAKLKLFNLTADTEEMEKVLTRFSDLTWLHPVLSSQLADKVHGLLSVEMDNPYTKVLDELRTIEKDFEIKIPEVKIDKTKYEFEAIKEYITSTHAILNKNLQQKRETLELMKKYREALTQVTHIENLDISLDDVFSLKYINVRVGILPVDSVDKLQLYQFKPFIFKSFQVENGNCWCMYFVTEDYKTDIDNVFKSLFFRRIHVPDFVHGIPIEAESTLLSEIDVSNENLKEIQEQIDKLLEKHLQKLSRVKSELIYMSKIYEAKRYVVTSGEKISLTGFVEDKKTGKLLKTFEDIESVKIQFRPPDSDKRLTPPTLLKNNWFTKPFSMFVEMYGVPGYYDLDPTPMVAITFCLLFGIMFGDFGQGLVLSLLGYILYKWKGYRLAAVAIRIGITSAFFGLLYGSFFGNDEILGNTFAKLYVIFGNRPIQPMNPDFTMNIIIATVLLGSILIISSMILNIVTSFRKKSWGELFFSENGIAGIIFYIFIVVGLLLRFGFSINIFNVFTIFFLIVLPLVLIMFQKPLGLKLLGKRMFPEGASGFVTDGVFGIFEILLSYITNTLSFLRIGGFVMSHAGMMLVVFTLMDMTPGAFGTYTTFIIGNLFVMAIEGLIVGIQVLRLEFYEMFSRYFEGEGTPFKPYM